MDAKRILLAGSDDSLRRSLAGPITTLGFEVVEVPSAEAARIFLGQDGADALVIDADPDDPAPLAVCRALRADGNRHPILLVGGGGPWREAGVTDRIAKPFRLTVLLQTLTRLMRERPDDGGVLAGYAFDALARTIDVSQGSPVALTEKEVAILAYLGRTGDRVVSREELLAEVWGYADDATTHTVETHIYRLRRKLGQEAAGLLVTETGGYRLVARASGRS